MVYISISASYMLKEMPYYNDLIRRCQEGDSIAFEKLYKIYRLDVYRNLYRILGPNFEIEDIIQEVFFQVFKSIRSFRGRSKFSTWLYRLTVNIALQELRKNRKRPLPNSESHISSLAANPNTSPLNVLEEKELQSIVYRILEKLPPKKRIVFIMHEIQGIPAAEIAKIVRAPLFTVRTRLFYARKEFYQLFAKERKKE
jgi:RNA polymerase sigma-70 factor (ECF subfamily)